MSSEYIKGQKYLDKLFPDSYSLRYLNHRNLFKKQLKEVGILELLSDTDIEMYYQFIEFYAYFNYRKVENVIKHFARVFKKIHYNRVVKFDSNYYLLDQLFRWCLITEFYPQIFYEGDWRTKVLNPEAPFNKVERSDQRGLFSINVLANVAYDNCMGIFKDVVDTWKVDKIVNDSGKNDFKEEDSSQEDNTYLHSTYIRDYIKSRAVLLSEADIHERNIYDNPRAEFLNRIYSQVTGGKSDSILETSNFKITVLKNVD